MRTFSPYEQNQLATYGVTLAEARKKGEMPVEYITGHVPFNDLDFLVTQDTLIPRVETEELVDQAVALAKELQAQKIPTAKKPLQLADVGTGCGAIGISVALELSKLEIPFELTLSDVSEAAIKVAKTNWQRLMPSAASFLVSDLLTAYPKKKKFDLFFANLPYIPSPRIAALDPSVVDFEPHLALDGGPEGLSLIESFLQQAETRITAQGRALLEMDYTHAEDILRLNPRFQGHIKIDTFGQARFAIFHLKP